MAVYTRGVLYVHSAPRAVCPHVEWAAGRIMGHQVDLHWVTQSVAPGLWRAEFPWNGEQGSGARLASALRGWAQLRYEVTEEPSRGCDGGRWSHVPDLGLHHAVIDVHGNAVIGEDRIRVALDAGDPQEMRRLLSLALGESWDAELEPFRMAPEGGAPVRWLHQVG